ncbi:MAG: Hsp70 family protein [Planctomycetales bacterium]|nr:Hsp70 family protein [Planctomycetales bacterium]
MSSLVPIGIDLGTTNCAVAFLDAEGATKMLQGPGQSRLTPSLVFFAEDRIVVGDDAWESGLTAPERLAENMKRDMGAISYRRKIDGRTYPAAVIQGCLLRQLRKAIVARFDDDYQAVITVPAYFDEARRKATLDAAIISGLNVLDVVNEPTAAALAFGEKLGYLAADGTPRESLNLMVYDLGGGTFDVTLIHMESGAFRTLATDGDYELGGLNWDQRLADVVKHRIDLVSGNGQPWSQRDELQLLRAARDAKHTLTQNPLASVVCNKSDSKFEIAVSRDEFEELTTDLLERTLFTTRQTLSTAGLLWDDVDRLLLTGGSTRMPAVGTALTEMSGLPVETTVDADEAVARGAALFARSLLSARGLLPDAPKLRVTDVNAHALGIAGVNLQTCRTENVTLIPRNTALPCDVARTFVTRMDNQPNVSVRLLEGESSIPAQCATLASARIKNLPPGLPKGTPIDVRYSLQANGILDVTAQIPGRGESAQIELKRERGLADPRVSRWKKIVCRDGGYRDLHEALAEVLSESPSESPNDAESDELLADDDAEASTARTPSAEPAVDFGAPLAAAETLKEHFRARRPDVEERHMSGSIENPPRAPSVASIPKATRRLRNVRRQPRLTNLIGHVLAAAIGLAAGYYLLCLVRPDLNFLQIDLPGVASPSPRSR